MKKKIIIIAAVSIAVIAAIVSFLVFGNGFGKKSEINAAFDGITLNEEFFFSLSKEPVRMGNSLLKNYSMNEEAINDIKENQTDWLAFNYFIDIDNPSEKDMLIDSLKVDNNGNDDVYLGTSLGGLQVINAGESGSVCVTLIIHSGDATVSESNEIAKKLNVEVKYTELPEDIDSEIPEENYNYAKVTV